MKESSSNTSTGLMSMLQIIFIVLKLCGLIDWSWPVVLIPLWIGLALYILVLVIVIIVAIVNYFK